MEKAPGGVPEALGCLFFGLFFGLLFALGLHGGELEALALITLHNSTKPFISLSIKTLSPRNSTQPYIGYVSIGLSRGLTA